MPRASTLGMSPRFLDIEFGDLWLRMDALTSLLKFYKAARHSSVGISVVVPDAEDTFLGGSHYCTATSYLLVRTPQAELIRVRSK